MSTLDVKLPELDDSWILQTDEAGEELLRFVANWGAEVKCKYPRHGQWDAYVMKVGSILRRLSRDLDDLEFPDMVGRALLPDQWAAIAAQIIADKAISSEITSAVIDFLRPEIDGQPVTKKWLDENAPIDGPARMLGWLLCPHDMLKKNLRTLLSRIFHHSLSPKSNQYSSTNVDSETEPRSGEQATSEFSSFY